MYDWPHLSSFDNWTKLMGPRIKPQDEALCVPHAMRATQSEDREEPETAQPPRRYGKTASHRFCPSRSQQTTVESTQMHVERTSVPSTVTKTNISAKTMALVSERRQGTVNPFGTHANACHKC